MLTHKKRPKPTPGRRQQAVAAKNSKADVVPERHTTESASQSAEQATAERTTMETTFARVPLLHEEVPALRWMFPLQYERDWVRSRCCCFSRASH
jgi:hypothetical protein